MGEDVPYGMEGETLLDFGVRGYEEVEEGCCYEKEECGEEGHAAWFGHWEESIEVANSSSWSLEK